MNPNKVEERIRLLGIDWSEKNYAASLLEETQKTMLAKCVNDILKKRPETAHNRADSEARAHPDYEDHVRQMVEARKEANIAKVKYDSAKTWFEAKRTVESTKRAEMKL